MNEIFFYLNEEKYYLGNIAEPKKVSSTVEHQEAELYPWKWHVPNKAQSNYNRHKSHR